MYAKGTKVKLEKIRREYEKSELSRSILSEDPIQQLKRWLEEACLHELTDATAMTLATVNSAGQPSQRVVLLKQLDEAGLVFYTNLKSRKARDIEQNEKVCANFAWLTLERQVRIEGTASRISQAESLKYFISRPKESRLSAWASNQSQPIKSRQLLLSAFEEMKAKFADGEIPLPSFWGGYRVTPTRYELWQGGSARLHDRFEYARSTETSPWEIRRLAP